MCGHHWFPTYIRGHQWSPTYMHGRHWFQIYIFNLHWFPMYFCCWSPIHTCTCVATFDLKHTCVYVYCQYSMRIFCHPWPSNTDVCPHFDHKKTCAFMIINIHVLSPMISKIHVRQLLIPIIYEQPPLISSKRAANVDPQHIYVQPPLILDTHLWSPLISDVYVQPLLIPNIHLQPPLITKTDVWPQRIPKIHFGPDIHVWPMLLYIHAWTVDPQYTCSHRLQAKVDSRHVRKLFTPNIHVRPSLITDVHLWPLLFPDTHVWPQLIPLSVMLSESKYYSFIE